MDFFCSALSVYRYMNNNNVTLVKAGIFQQISRVMVLELRGNPLVNVQLEAFAFLPRLKKLCVNFNFFFFFLKPTHEEKTKATK